jgi:hypothetical protein
MRHESDKGTIPNTALAGAFSGNIPTQDEQFDLGVTYYRPGASERWPSATRLAGDNSFVALLTWTCFRSLERDARNSHQQNFTPAGPSI